MGNIHWGDRAMCLSIPHMSKIPKGAVYRGEEGSCLPQWNEMWSRVLNRQRMPLLDATGTVIVTCLGSPRSEALAHLLRRIWYFNDVDQIACYENSPGRVVRVVVYLILSYLILSHLISCYPIICPAFTVGFAELPRNYSCKTTGAASHSNLRREKLAKKLFVRNTQTFWRKTVTHSRYHI